MQPWQCAALAPGAKSYKRCICTTTASPPFLAAWRRALSFHTVQGVQECFQVLRRMCHPSRCSEGAWRTCRSWPWSGLGNKSHESYENTSARYSPSGDQIHNSTSAAGHQGLGMAGIVATGCHWCFKDALRCHGFCNWRATVQNVQHKLAYS